MNGIRKICTGCKTSKPLSEFYPRSHAPGATYAACKDCKRMRERVDYQQARAAESGTVRKHSIYAEQTRAPEPDWEWLE